jgi:hypothetical protein
MVDITTEVIAVITMRMVIVIIVDRQLTGFYPSRDREEAEPLVLAQKLRFLAGAARIYPTQIDVMCRCKNDYKNILANPQQDKNTLAILILLKKKISA